MKLYKIRASHGLESSINKFNKKNKVFPSTVPISKLV